MKKLLTRLTASAASAVIAVSTLNALTAIFAADTETPTEIHVTFDLSDPDIFFSEDEDGNIVKPEDITGRPNSSVKIPAGSPEKEGYQFVGWTADDFFGYEPGDIYRVYEEDVVMKPIFREKGSEIFVLSYEVEMGGEIIDTSLELPSKKVTANTLLKASFMSYQDSEKKSTGWTDGEHKILQEQKFIMPAHDVVLTPIWHRRLTFTYLAGDYDDIVGATSCEYDVIESQTKDVNDGTRFARIGYAIDHWHCDYDDQDYAFFSEFTMPDQDVTMTAVWKPVQYVVVFKTKVSGTQNIKVPGATGDTIKVPEMTVENEGYTFGGWTYDGKTYQPGDDFLIKGALPGAGIGLEPIWIANDEPETTTTTTTTTAPTTTTTTVTTIGDQVTAPINILKKPDKLSYVKNSGEKIDLTGMKVSIGGVDPEVDADKFYLLSTLNGNEDIAYFYIVDDSDFDITKAGTYRILIGKNSDDNSGNNTFTVEVVEDASSVDIKYGDANCNGSVDLGDAVLIMQSIANPDKYGEKGTAPEHITAEGKKNSDVTGNGDGVTSADALAIQKFMLKLIDKLPVTE